MPSSTIKNVKRRTDGRTPVGDALARVRGAFTAVAVFSLGVNLLMLAVPLYMFQVFDRVLGSRSEETLIMLTLVTVGGLALLGGLDMVRSWVMVRVGVRLDFMLGGALFTNSVQRSLLGRGQDVQGLRDLGQLRGFLTGPGVFALFEAPWVPVYIGIVYLFHPLLGSLALGGAVLLLLLALVNELVTRRPLLAANRASMANYNHTQAQVRNADVVAAMGMMPALLGRWQRNNSEVLHWQAMASDRAGLVTGASKSVRLMLQVVTLGTGAYLVIANDITPGIMIAATFILSRALAPIEMAIGTWKQLVAARAAYRRMNDDLEQAAPSDTSMPLPRPEGRLSVEGLVFVPPGGDKPVLRGVSFRLEAGEALGIIGPTAAGKSTLARLLVGSWRPTAGHVRLDGAEVSSWERQDFGRHVGYLPQDVELFAGTVQENIGRMGEADPEATVAAARLAGVHEMILRLPKGYDTPIENGGFILSGGQRQRIALARALFGDPRLLVLDEPNASLDSDGEDALLNAMATAKLEGRTVVIIAHRPSILHRVDKMLVLKEGRVAMFGNREEVLARTVPPATLVRPLPGERGHVQEHDQSPGR